MNDKRDAETDLLLDIQKIIGAELSYEGVTLARYIESRETREQDRFCQLKTSRLSPTPTPN